MTARFIRAKSSMRAQQTSRTRTVVSDRAWNTFAGCVATVAFALHGTVDVSENLPSTVPTLERRASGLTDRRRNSRSGRRKTDPHVDWQRVAFLFGVYAAYMSMRSLPANVWKFFSGQRPITG
jgi:hypothetical protein